MLEILEIALGTCTMVHDGRSTFFKIEREERLDMFLDKV